MIVLEATTESNPQELIRWTTPDGNLWSVLRVVAWVSNNTFYYKWQRAASTGWRTFPFDLDQHNYSVSMAGQTSSTSFALGYASIEFCDLHPAIGIEVSQDFSGNITFSGYKYWTSVSDTVEVSFAVSEEQHEDPPVDESDNEIMYAVYVDDQLLYMPGMSEYAVKDPKLEIAVNHAGSFTVKIPETNAEYANVLPLATTVKVVQGDYTLFKGRILGYDKDFDNLKTLSCEGLYGFLNDSWQEPFEYSGTVKGLLEFLLARHNERVLERQRLTLAWSDMDAAIEISTDRWMKTIEVVKSLLNMAGGYITQASDGTNSLIYSAGARQSVQAIRLGYNLLDVAQSYDASSVVNAIIPVGKDDLMLPEVYLENQDSIDFFKSRVEAVIQYSDADTEDKLRAYASADLRAMSVAVSSIVVKAVDMHCLDANIPRIKVGTLVKVDSLYHNLDAYLLCVGATIPLQDPARTEYEFGAVVQGLSDILAR